MDLFQIKYSPRKMCLVKEESPSSSSSSPPVLMDKRNVQLFLSHYGELIAQEATQKLAIYGQTQASLFNRFVDVNVVAIFYSSMKRQRAYDFFFFL